MRFISLWSNGHDGRLRTYRRRFDSCWGGKDKVRPLPERLSLGVLAPDLCLRRQVASCLVVSQEIAGSIPVGGAVVRSDTFTSSFTITSYYYGPVAGRASLLHGLRECSSHSGATQRNATSCKKGETFLVGVETTRFGRLVWWSAQISDEYLVIVRFYDRLRIKTPATLTCCRFGC